MYSCLSVLKYRNILIISVILVIIGIAILFFQFQDENQGISSQQQSVPQGNSLTVIKNLDPAQSKNGIYSVQMLDFKDGYNVKIDLTDPVGNVITTKSIANDAFEENFTISHLGNYTLQIQNTGQNETEILAKIGYYPQVSVILDISDFIILIAGLSGLSVGMVLLVKSRGKTESN